MPRARGRRRGGAQAASCPSERTLVHPNVVSTPNGLGAWRLCDCEKPPLAWHPLQAGDAAVLEGDLRPSHQVLTCAGDQHLARSRFCGDARTHVNRDPADLAVNELALTRVEASTHLKTELANTVADRAGGMDRARRPVKTGEKTVVGRFDLLAPESLDLPPNCRLVRPEQL